MSQPKWKTLYSTDYSRVEVDETGVYDPEMEIAQEVDSNTWEVFRFSLERYKIVEREDTLFLVPFQYQSLGWPHPIVSYAPWFLKDLESVAKSHGTSVRELEEALCSNSVKGLAWAYECIGGHHGFRNLDSNPLTLTNAELNDRWS